MFCDRCGALNTDDALFCNKCGNPISAAGTGEGVASGTGPSVAAMGGEPTQTYISTPSPGPFPPYAGVPSGMQQLGYVPYVAPRAYGLCIAGMVLGIVSLVLFFIPLVAISCGVLGIILGSIGIKNVQSEPQAKTGQGMGVAGWSPAFWAS